MKGVTMNSIDYRYYYYNNTNYVSLSHNWTVYSIS